MCFTDSVSSDAEKADSESLGAIIMLQSRLSKCSVKGWTRGWRRSRAMGRSLRNCWQGVDSLISRGCVGAATGPAGMTREQAQVVSA